LPAGIPFAEKPCANAATGQTGPGPSSDDGADSLRNPDPATSAGWCPNPGSAIGAARRWQARPDHASRARTIRSRGTTRP